LLTFPQIFCIFPFSADPFPRFSHNLKILIDTDGEGDLKPMVPWFRGFKGTIKQENERFVSTGVWKRTNQTTIEITELPIHKSTQSYKEFLETLLECNEIVDYKNNCDESLIDFKIILQKSIIDSLTDEEIIKRFKLTSYINTSNFHVFDENCKIRKMSCPEEIIFRFYKVRKEHYTFRKKYLTNKLEESLTLLQSKIRFIKMVINDELVIFRKKKEEILSQIEKVSPPLKKVDGSFGYLLEMKIHIFTEEKIKELEELIKKEQKELEELISTSISTTWNNELKIF